MVTAGVSPEALELLQRYGVDIRDFTRADKYYNSEDMLNGIIARESKQTQGQTEEELAATIKDTQRRLEKAWNEYVISVQRYFNRVAREIARDLIGGELEDETDPLSFSCSVRNVPDLAPVAEHVGAKVDTEFISVKDLSGTEKAVDLKGLRGVPQQGGTRPPSPFHLLDRVGANPLSATPISAPSPSQAPLVGMSRAERMNDFCVLAEKFCFRHERYFDVPVPLVWAQLTSQAVASVSRLYRLLGMRIAYLCSGSIPFMRRITEDLETPYWVGMCGDREISVEVGALLSLMERMVSLREERREAYPNIPFSWLYRLEALINPQDPMVNLPPKHKSQAIRIAIRLLKVSPAQATAVQLHISLLRNCLSKGEATADESAAVVKALLNLLDDPSTRKYLRLNEIGVLFTPFLETSTAGSNLDTLARLNLSKDMIALLMTTWVGSFWIMWEATFIRSLIHVLHLPGDLDRKMVIFTLFNKILVNLAPHRGIAKMEPWTGVEGGRRRRVRGSSITTSGAAEAEVTGNSTDRDFLARLNTDNSMSTVVVNEFDSNENYVPTRKALGYHIMDPLLGTVLIGLSHHGLPLALINLLQTAGRSHLEVRIASQLLQDICVLMDTVLPQETSGGLHEAFNRALGRLTRNGNPFVSNLTSRLFHGCKSRGWGGKSEGAGCAAISSPLSSATQPATQIVMTASFDMDDTAFLNALRDTRVEKNPTNFRVWNFDLLLLLVQGPLRTVNRLRTAAPVLKALINFYTPHNGKRIFSMRPFSSLKVEEASVTMCQLGIELVNLLLSTHDGADLIRNAGMATAVGSMLKEARTDNPQVLSKERVSSRIGHTLLRMTGRFSAYANGLIIMQESNLFLTIDSLFRKLQDSRPKQPEETDVLEDVCHQLLQYLYIGVVPNYGVCDDIRYTIRSALRNPSNSIRLCAVKLLKTVVWHDLSTSMKWGIEMLVQVLHDDSVKIVKSAFGQLLSICMFSDEGLDYLISLLPTVLMESELILENAKTLKLDSLLYRIVERPSGFSFLQSYGWVEKELRRWESTASVEYVKMVNLQVMGEFNITSSNNSARPVKRWLHSRTISESMTMDYSKLSITSPVSGGIPLLTAESASEMFFPVHFAAVLCHSAEGCAVFKLSSLWNRSVAQILAQPLPPDIVSDHYIIQDNDTSEDSDEEVALEGMMVSHLNEASEYSAVKQYSSHTFTSLPHPTIARGGDSVGNSLSSVHSPLVSPAEMRELLQGRLPNNNMALSAVYNYQPTTRNYSMECVGDALLLKDALMCICQACSSDAGYELMHTVPTLLKHIISLSRFSSTLSIRGIAIIGACILSRCKRFAEELARDNIVVFFDPNAYISADGVPYSVAFAHARVMRGMLKNYVATDAIAEYVYRDKFPDTTGVPKRIYEAVFALSNPVSREGAKAVLYKMMRRRPELFVEPSVRNICLDSAGMYRMRHAERKFIADLIENAQLTTTKDQ